jgi:hypothetical protein
VNSHDRHIHQVLSEIEAGQKVSQRTLATRLGIALGLTNLLIRRVVRKGWVRVIRIRPNRVTYLLTPAGIAEKARMSQLYLQESVRFYGEARDRVRERLAHLPASAHQNGARGRLVFYGPGEVAEIAYVCLQETDFDLVGVVGDRPRAPFFGHPVRMPDDLSDGVVGDVDYDHVVVTSFDNRDAIRERLLSRGVSPARVVWL